MAEKNLDRDAFLSDEEQYEREEQLRLDKLRQASSNAELKAENRSLKRSLERQESRLQVFEALSRNAGQARDWPQKTSRPHEATMVLVCSDWHVGETVDPGTVGGLNEYNPQIAQRRAKKLAEGARWLLESWRERGGYGWKIDRIVCALIGDMMTGFIHEDLRETNSMSPTQEVLFAQDLIRDLLGHLTKIKGIKEIVVPCAWGNHGRTTPERRIQTAWQNSYEWMLYQQLAGEYANHPKVHFVTGRDEIVRMSIYKTRFRFTHGDQFRYQGGVGGIAVPGLRWLSQVLDPTEPADVTVVGHWHQAKDFGNLVVNNCLIGHGVYSGRVAPYSKPSQVAFLVDAKYGKRMTTEIFV